MNSTVKPAIGHGLTLSPAEHKVVPQNIIEPKVYHYR